jgi:Transposase DDE domain
MPDINTTNTTQKSIIQKLKMEPGLPFKELISRDMMNQALADIEYREGDYTPDVTVSCLLSQALDEDQSLQASVLRLIASKAAANEEPPSANTSAYSQARSRLPVKVLETLSEQTAINTTSEALPQWRWRGRPTKLVDGSTLSMPDTEANQKRYPQPASQKEGVGFPLARFLVIICFVTGIVLKFAMDAFAGKETGEHALLRQVLDSFNQGDIMLGDAYFPSFFLVCELINRGVDFVFPAHASRHRDFRSGTKLGKKDHLVSWHKPSRPEWMDQEKYDSYPSSIQVREVEVINEKPGFRAMKRVLVTSFLDEQKVSKQDLSELYGFRWFVELDIRSIKSVMKMDVLRSKTPEMIQKEIGARLLAYNLVRQIMVHAAIKHNKTPRQLSFKTALRAVEIFRQQGIFTIKDTQKYDALLQAIAHKEVGNRPGRLEPRAIKRRPKPQKRLQKPRSFYKNTFNQAAA